MAEDSTCTVKDLKGSVSEFVHERSWEKFHDPKNLAESIVLEASELLEFFQWLTTEEAKNLGNDKEKVSEISEELADVVIYCLSMANELEIDVSSSVWQKIEKNKKKYPIGKFYGKARE